MLREIYYFYVSIILLVQGILDVRERVVSNRLNLLLVATNIFYLIVFGAEFIDIRLIVAYTISICVLYGMGVIGAGDLKTFLIVSLVIKTDLLVYLTLFSLIATFLIIQFNIDDRPPIIFIFSIMETLCCMISMIASI